jgi:hypothetical protein
MLPALGREARASGGKPVHTVALHAHYAYYAHFSKPVIPLKNKLKGFNQERGDGIRTIEQREIRRESVKLG